MKKIKLNDKQKKWIKFVIELFCEWLLYFIIGVLLNELLKRYDENIAFMLFNSVLICTILSERVLQLFFKDADNGKF